MSSNNELLEALNILEREKNISKEPARTISVHPRM